MVSRARLAMAVAGSIAGVMAAMLLAGALLLSYRQTGHGTGGKESEKPSGGTRPSPAEPAKEPPRTADELIALLKGRNPRYDGRCGVEVLGGVILDVDLRDTAVQDLSPLRGMSLRSLVCSGTKVTDLTPLAGMPLRYLECVGNRIRDLSPLSGMPLVRLQCQQNWIADLSPLRGMPLRYLDCSRNPISDLEPLRGLPLEHLDCSDTSVADLTPLKGMPLKRLCLHNSRVADLTPLQGIRLDYLGISGVRTRDFSAVRAIPLRRLSFTLEHVSTGLSSLRDHPTLEGLAVGARVPGPGLPPGVFWAVQDSRQGRRPAPTLKELLGPDLLLRERLDKAMQQEISFECTERDFSDVLSFIASHSRLSFAVDPRDTNFTDSNPKITLKARNIPVADALRQVCLVANRVCSVSEGALFFSTPGAKESSTAKVEEICSLEDPSKNDPMQWLSSIWSRVSCDISFTPREDALALLDSQASISVIMDPGEMREEPWWEYGITARMDDVRFIDALRWLCRGLGATPRWLDGAFIITTPKRLQEIRAHEQVLSRVAVLPPVALGPAAARINYGHYEMRIGEVIAAIGEQASIPVVADPDEIMNRKLRVMPHLTDMRLDCALRWICRVTGLVYVWRDGKLLITTPERALAEAAKRKSK